MSDPRKAGANSCRVLCHLGGWGSCLAMEANALTTFTTPSGLGGMNIRVVDIEHSPWFVAADVFSALGLTGGWNSSRHLNADEKRVFKKGATFDVVLFKGTKATALLISEAGLYKLVLRSDKPEAKAFQTWVARDVLPAIRKTGSYVQGEEVSDWQYAA